MHVDHKHVTTVNLLDGQAHDFVLRKDGGGFKLSGIAKDEVVHILLSPHDFHRLRQQIQKPDKQDATVDAPIPAEKRQSVPMPAATCVLQWSTTDWLSFN
jgi:hypothetical protein